MLIIPGLRLPQTIPRPRLRHQQMRFRLAVFAQHFLIGEVCGKVIFGTAYLTDDDNFAPLLLYPPWREAVACAHRRECPPFALDPVVRSSQARPSSSSVAGPAMTSSELTASAGQPSGRCCIPPTRGAMKRRPRTESDGQGELVERGRQPPVHLLLDGKLVVTSTEVLDEGMAGDLHMGLVNLPAVTNGMPAGPGGLGQ